MYIKLSKNLTENKFIEPSTLYNNIDDFSTDWYTSNCYYTKEQVDLVLNNKKTTGKFSVAGIHDVITNKLWFDFDNKDLTLALMDARLLVNKLRGKGFDDEGLQVCFSGYKGFSIVIETDQWLTPEQVKNVCFDLASNLSTFDKSVYDAPRVFRVPLTKHQESGLYKTPLTLEDLFTLDITQIKQLAKDVSDIKPLVLSQHWKKISFPQTIKINQVSEKPKKREIMLPTSLDYTKKPKFLSNCKYELQNGRFKEGMRSNALICLASTYKNQGFDLEHIYRLLKGVCELQSRWANEDRYPDEELYNNIVMQVCSPTWNGGQYSCKKDGWLKDYCNSLGDNKCKHDDDKVFHDTDVMHKNFKTFAKELDQNIIKTGIKGLDDKLTLTTSMLVGLLGAPSSGKTSAIYTLLNTASKNNIKSAFFSLDMGLPLVTMRLLQKHTGLDQKAIYNAYKNDKESELLNQLESEYKNVKFCFKSGMSVDDIRKAVVDYRENTGQRLRLIVVDYLECLQSEWSDQNASVAMTAKKLKDLANEEQILIVLLLQTQKMSGDPSAPLLSMRNVKGASTLEQDCSVIISLYREGFSPTNPEFDKYITLSVVKNRMGSLFSIDCGFNGLTSQISYPLSDDDEALLWKIREDKKKKSESSDKKWWT